MKWLKDFVDLDVSPKEFAEKMTMSGSKVEKYEIEGENLNRVVVGKVVSIEKHPDADKLVVCMVDVGENEPIQIVTGAKNLNVEDVVPVALDGSTLTDGTKIKKGKLRGVASFGMMCSLAELGLSINDFPYAVEDGIFVLQEESYSLGQDIREVIGFNDTKFEFEITPNRPDCLSVIGLAREAAATFDKKLALQVPNVTASAHCDKNELNVNVLDKESCPFYSAKIVKNVKIAPSPRFIRERLRAMGLRSINNIVDITNYVMLEYGQPMHAFDLRYIGGNQINVRKANKNETITTLDGVERKLTEHNLVIADTQKPIALAGVMGGEFSSVMNDTSTIVLESAIFDPITVRVASKEQNLRTDSSARFEKGLDKNVCITALNRACELIETLGIGEVVSDTIIVDNSTDIVTKIPFEPDFINKFLNINLSSEKMIAILEKIECKVVDNLVIIPSFRKDLKIKNDIAEEIARFYGYNNIASTPLLGSHYGKFSESQKFDQKIINSMIALGLSEIKTYSFISPKQYDKILLPTEHPLRNSVTISNPLGEDTSLMRTTAVVSMLDILSSNHNHKNENAQLFEIAREYIPNNNAELPTEKNKLIAGFYGENVDFLYVKGVVENLLDSIFIKNYEFETNTNIVYFHPGRCADIICGDGILGHVAEVHPSVLENYDLSKRVYIIELDVDTSFSCSNCNVSYNPITKFPAVNRDLALICDKNTPVGELQKIIKNSASKLLESVRIFDVYEGEQIPENKKSVALNISLRSSTETLTDEQVNSTIKKIMKAFENNNISLRS